MSKVLVTGGSGFVGSHCVLQLLEQGHEVRATVRDLAKSQSVLAMLRQGGLPDPGPRLTFVAADLERDAGWAEAAAGCDIVLHVASPFPAGVPEHEQVHVAIEPGTEPSNVLTMHDAPWEVVGTRR